MRDIILHFDLLIEEINNEIKKQKKYAQDAIDMDDWELAQEVFSSVNKNVPLMKEWINSLNNIKNQITESDMFKEDESNEAEEEKIIQDENPQTEEKEEVVLPEKDNTTDIRLISEEWHCLNEDFLSVKIKAVLFGDRIYNVKDMTDALIMSCDCLYQYDSDKFMMMLKSPFVHGRTMKYISETPYDNIHGYEANCSKKMRKADIYVLVNINNNQKANLILNMLEFYDLPYDFIKVAIREDFISAKRDFYTRERAKKETEIIDWSDDIVDEKTYSKPINPYISENNEETEIAEDTFDENIGIKDLCEELILKYPYKMIFANRFSEVGKLFCDNERDAEMNMTAPYMLSNGMWVETENVTTEDLRNIRKIAVKNN